MGIFSTYKKYFFENTAPLRTIKGEDLVRHYKIQPHIPYNSKIHWILYDFKNEKIYKRDISGMNTMMDFAENTYKDENGNDIDFIISEYIEKNSSNLMTEVMLPENKAILAIFKDTNNEENIISNEDYIWYNIYHTFIQGKICHKTKEYISDIKYNLIPELNWIWFRKSKDAYLTKRIVKRASSWIDLNPEITFHLWTNLENEAEVIDFFSQADPEGTFRSRIIVHCKNETLNIAKEFCEENFQILKNENLWSLYEEILTNNNDKASMIFKTDILRCMILYMKGGWYADFNDTYGFTSLKYILNPEKRNMIYLGCDIVDRQNNYIMYSPKYNSKWLELTSQIVKGGCNVYKIIKFKDVNFIDSVRKILKTFKDTCLENNPKESIIERIIPKLNIMISIYNVKVAEMIEKYKLEIPYSFSFNFNEILLLFKYIFKAHSSFPISHTNSSLSDRISYELENSTTLSKNRKGEMTHRFKNFDKEHLWKETLEELQSINIEDISDTTIINNIIFVNMEKLLKICNMGTYYHNSPENRKFIYNIPHCYVLGAYTFLTALGHIGDGTSCGGDICVYNDDAI
jgi:hypothetical protein